MAVFCLPTNPPVQLGDESIILTIALTSTKIPVAGRVVWGRPVRRRRVQDNVVWRSCCRLDESGSAQQALS